MTNNNCLNALVSLPDVLGAFLSNNDGQVVAANMPDYLASDQIFKAAKLLSQQRGAASAAVGALERCEFRYLEYKFFIYYLPDGVLFLLCRPKANAQRIDFEVDLFGDDLKVLLDQNEVFDDFSTLESPVTKSIDTTDQVPVKKNKKLVWVVVILLLGVAGLAGYFYGFDSISEQPESSVSFDPPSSPPAPSAPAVAETQTADSPQKEQPVEVLLRVAGSPTIGAQLAPEVAVAFMKQEMHGKDVRLTQGKADTTTRVEATLGNGKQVAIEFSLSTSADAFSCLKSGTCDIGMSSRPVNHQEMSQLADIGPMNNPASEHILALDGIAVILHPVNGLDVLSRQQLAAIFNGTIDDWSQLPNSQLSGKINVYGRNVRSGTGSVFSRIILNNSSFSARMTEVVNDNKLAESVAKDTKGIGFVSLPYAKTAKAIAISQQGAASVYPTAFTIATEDYPLSHRLYFYTSVNPENYLTRPFVQFALRDAGQVAASNSGLIPLSIDKVKVPIVENAPEEYRQAIAGSSRLSLNFRFKSGSSELDNRGRRDLERLVGFLTRGENQNKAIRLFGFTDSRGERAANCYLSKIRAEKVATILQWRGVQTEIIKGFCDDMPIASNTTANGRDKNRRVEVWLAE